MKFINEIANKAATALAEVGNGKISKRLLEHNLIHIESFSYCCELALWLVFLSLTLVSAYAWIGVAVIALIMALTYKFWKAVIATFLFILYGNNSLNFNTDENGDLDETSQMLNKLYEVSTKIKEISDENKK